MKPGLCSILIPAYNAEQYLEESVNSILNQTQENIEILLCDDCSTDGTKKIIENLSDTRIRKFYNTENKGYLNTCNLLFKETKGEFIGFQDADDYSDVQRIQKQVHFLEQNPEIGMCGTNFIRKNSKQSETQVKQSNYPTTHAEIEKYIHEYENLPFCGASVIVRKSVYDIIKGYRTFYDRLGYEHFDWFLLILEKFKVANLSESLYHYRYVSNSFSRSNLQQDFRKFYVKDICFFLKNQRVKNGIDGLSDSNLKLELDAYLEKLKTKFQTEQPKISFTIINRSLGNGDHTLAFKLIKETISKQMWLGVGAYSKLILALLKQIVKKFIK